MDIETDAKGLNRKVANQKANEIGITLTTRENNYGTYTLNVYDENAQKFVVDNLGKILEHAQGRKQETTWSESHDKMLID